MTTFFSGTDQRELLDNASNFNLYLSLIVNNDILKPGVHDSATTCWITQQTKSVKKYTVVTEFLNSVGKVYSTKKEKGEEAVKEVVYWKVKVSYPEIKPNLPSIFINRLDEICKEKKVVNPSIPGFNWEQSDNLLFSKAEEATVEQIIQDFLPKWIEGDETFEGTVLDALYAVSQFVYFESKHYSIGETFSSYRKDLIESFSMIWNECFGYEPILRDRSKIKDALRLLKVKNLSKKESSVLKMIEDTINDIQ